MVYQDNRQVKILSNSYFCQRDISNGDLIFFSLFCSTVGSRTSVAVSHVQIRSSAVEEGSRLLQFEFKTRDITDIIFYVCKNVA